MGSEANIIDRALRIADEAHSGQKDRYGAPYILHPLRVGLAGESEEEMAAGFLHDVAEDSDDWTLERLAEEGFPERVLRIVDCLTKRVGESWERYIARVMTDEGAMRLKLRDLEDNMNARRAPAFGADEAERFARYVWAWRKIKNASTAEPR